MATSASVSSKPPVTATFTIGVPTIGVLGLGLISVSVVPVALVVCSEPLFAVIKPCAPAVVVWHPLPVPPLGAEVDQLVPSLLYSYTVDPGSTALVSVAT